MTEMISKCFFASFRTLPFVFLYGDQEPRSWGGGAFKRPPSRRWKIQRPSRARVNATRITVSAKVNAARVRVKVNATRVKVSAKVNAARVRVKVYATRVTESAKVNAARIRVKEYATRFQKRRKIPLGRRKMPSIIRVHRGGYERMPGQTSD